jgi:hypothetical protein
MAFNEEKYKAIFDQRYGKGSFDSRMASARAIGTSIGRAKVAKSDYTKRTNELKKAQERAIAEATAMQEKTNQDQATQKDLNNAKGLGTGTVSYADKMLRLHDPEMAQKLAQDRADAQRKKANTKSTANPSSKPEYKWDSTAPNEYANPDVQNYYNQSNRLDDFISKLKTQTTARDKADYKAGQTFAKKNQMSVDEYKKIGGTKLFPTKQDYNEQVRIKTAMDKLKSAKTQSKKADKKVGLLALQKVKKKNDGSFLNMPLDAVDLLTRRPLKAIGQALNTHDDVSAKDAFKNIFKDKPTKKEKDTVRNLERTANSTMLGLPSQITKAVTGKEADYLSHRKFGHGGGTDMLTDGLGYVGPSIAAKAGLKALGLGVKEGSRGLSKFGQIMREGGLIGGAIGTGEVGVREALNPHDTNYKDNLKHIGMGIGIGAAGDGALHGLGLGAKAGTKAIGKNLTKGLLPSNKGLAKSFSSTLKDTKRMPMPNDILRDNPLSRLKAKDQGLNVNVPKGLRNLKSTLDQYAGTGKRVDLLPPSSLLDALPNGPRPSAEFSPPSIRRNPLIDMMPSGERPRADFRGAQGKSELPVNTPDNATPAYWQHRYESFVNYVKSNYDENRLTDSALEDIWSQFAKADEPSLHDVVDLAYTNYKPAKDLHANDVVRNNQPVLNQLKKRMGVDESAFNLPPKQKVLNTPGVMDYLSTRKPASKTTMKRMGIEPTREAPPLNRLSQLGNQQSAVASEAVRPINDPFNALRRSSGKTNSTGKGNFEAIRNPKSVKDSGQKITSASVTQKPVSKALLDGIDPKGLKDVSGLKAYTTDPYRLGRDVFGKDYPTIKKRVFDPFDASKKARVQEEHHLLNKLKTDVVDKYGITKGSKKSALIQKYGEKQITLDELKQQAPKDWKDIVESDKWFRDFYDNQIDEINGVRARIYPNRPEMQIPKRNDYYRHFKDLSGLEGVKNLFDNTSGIDTSLIGTSEYTNPNSKFLSFAQKRGLGRFKNDAVGGVLDYVRAATYAKHIDPHISVFKQLKKEIAQGTNGKNNADNYLQYLDDYSKDLAGKTNPADRFIQKVIPGGRVAFTVLQKVNNRVKKNTILGNVGSSLSQLANIPNGIGFAKQHSVEGMGKSLAAIFKDIPEMKESGFLKERFGDSMYRKFDTRWFEQPQKFASWMLETSDKLGTNFIWNSAHAKGVAKGVENPVKYADDATRSLVAGRGIGEIPILQKSKLFQLVAPFQLEVANLWRVQQDFVKAKDFGGIATLFLGSFLFNKAMEETRGTKVVFDPISAMLDASTKGLTPLQRGGRLAGEVLSNVPLGQTVASVYPEYGTKVLGKQLPTREELFGDRDPTRFGSSLLAVKGLQDPIFKLLPPMGGLQAQKTIKGLSAIRKEGVYNKDGTKLNHPVSPTLENRIKGTLFGQYSSDEAKDYFKNDRRPLTEKQTKEYEMNKQLGMGDQYYHNLLKVRKDKADAKEKIKKLEELFKKIQKKR